MRHVLLSFILILSIGSTGLTGGNNGLLAQTPSQGNNKTLQKEYKQAKRWAKAGSWAPEGLKMKLHPSTDYLEFQRQYQANREIWDKAFEAIAKADKDLSAFTSGPKQEIIEGRCNITVSDYTPKPADQIRLEGHLNFTDIQISTGTVLWGVSTVEDSQNTVPYNPAKDIAFYTSDKATVIKQKSSKPYIFLFFPKNLHIPAYQAPDTDYSTPLKKLVVKVEYVK